MNDPFLSAAGLLPERLQAALLALSPERRAAAEEFRLRADRGFSITVGGREQTVLTPVSHQEVAETVVRAAKGSLHSAAESLRRGYLTAPGGHRVGVCGSAALDGTAVAGLRAFTSVSVRIAKEVRGIAAPIARLALDRRRDSFLILSPPGAGKTTLLRELVREVSERGLRVGVADERSELAGCFGDGGMAFDLGRRTDVLDGVPKGEGALMLLRSMSPSVIAMDEITGEQRVLEQIAGCGVAVYATMHAWESDDREENRFRDLKSIFQWAVLIKTDGGGNRCYEVKEL